MEIDEVENYISLDNKNLDSIHDENFNEGLENFVSTILTDPEMQEYGFLIQLFQKSSPLKRCRGN